MILGSLDRKKVLEMSRIREYLMYWVCGLIFTVIIGILTWLLSLVIITPIAYFVPILGIALYLIIVPYVTGRLIVEVPDWLDMGKIKG